MPLALESRHSHYRNGTMMVRSGVILALVVVLLQAIMSYQSTLNIVTDSIAIVLDTDTARSEETRKGTGPPSHARNWTQELMILTEFRNIHEISQICRRNKGGATLVVENQVLDPSVTHPPGRKIPRVVHTTAKTRCVTKTFQNNLNLWKQLPDYSFFIHDDSAVHTLLQRHWPELPNLHLLLPCLLAGAALADLYRYVLLYEYGGIYTDMDNAPGRVLLQEYDAIQPQHDAVLTREGGGFPSQYFMAISPRHPLMYLAIQSTFHTVLGLGNIRRQYGKQSYDSVENHIELVLLL